MFLHLHDPAGAPLHSPGPAFAPSLPNYSSAVPWLPPAKTNHAEGKIVRARFTEASLANVNNARTSFDATKNAQSGCSKCELAEARFAKAEVLVPNVFKVKL